MSAASSDTVARVAAFAARQGLPTGQPPAHTSKALARAQAVAPLPLALEALYARADALRVGGVELFQLDDYVDVNRDRSHFGELAEGIFVASDLASGWFFVDAADALGLGPDFVHWCDRGSMTADDCVPAAPSLIDLLEAAERGESPWLAPMLGDRAVARLRDLLARSRAVATRAPLDPSRLREPGRPPLTLRLADILLAADGVLLPRSGRELLPYESMTPVPGSVPREGDLPAVWIGRGPQGVRYGSTADTGWQGWPGDRLFAVAPGQSLHEAVLLGRTADVWSHWIQADEQAGG